jgi:hypothetical protein
MAHLEDEPGRTAMDPQRLIQRAVERGAVAPELAPELLLPPGVGERRGILDGPLHLGGRPAREDEVSAPCPQPPPPCDPRAASQGPPPGARGSSWAS